MAIAQAMTTSFKVEILEGYHAFSASYRAADTFKLALYTSTASLGAGTTAYATADEVPSAGGYTAGGNTLTLIAPISNGTTALLDFADTTWSASTISTDGALIYNSTQGNRAVAVLAFGATKASSGSDLAIQFPVADSTNAILRIA
jgi:hypothetical protein